LRALWFLITPLQSLATSASHGVCMYRIELSPGEETVFRSIEELAVAVKRGVVTPRARIWHNASSRWLPIQFHPHYKAALSMPLTQAALVAGPPVKPLSSLSLQQPEEPEPPVAAITPPVSESATPESVPTRKKKARSGQSAKRSGRSTRPRRQLRIALVGALLVGGAQWVLSAPLFSGSEAPALLRAQRHLIAAQTEAIKQVPNTAAIVPVPSAQASTSPAALEQLAEPVSGPTAPSFGGTGGSIESGDAAHVEPAPAGVEMSPPPAPLADSLGVKLADSAGQKAINQMPRNAASPAGKKPAAKQ
jgi:hypothetical protein